MKKVIVIILAILTLLTCIVLLDNSVFFSVDIVADTSSESILQPGDTLNFYVQYSILGRKIKKTSIPDIQTSSAVCTINDSSAVSVSKDALTGEEIELNVSYNSKIRKISQTFNYVVKYSLDESIDANGVVLEPTRIDVLVTKNRAVPKSYIPNDLVRVNVKFLSAHNKMRAEAAHALENLFKGASNSGYTLYGASGYRSYYLQSNLYSHFVAAIGTKKANIRVAKAGKSEHQTGLAVDISSKSAVNKGVEFGDTAEGKWVINNAYKYGFIIRYPKDAEDITGYMYEPWHLRYVGVNLAKKIYESGLTFEEYMLK